MLSLTSTALAAGLKGGGLLCRLNPLCRLLLSKHILPFINAAEPGFGRNGQQEGRVGSIWLSSFWAWLVQRLNWKWVWMLRCWAHLQLTSFVLAAKKESQLYLKCAASLREPHKETTVQMWGLVSFSWTCTTTSYYFSVSVSFRAVCFQQK
jgi:hypothetical protein